MIEIPKKITAKIWVLVKQIGWSSQEFYNWLHDIFGKPEVKSTRLHDLNQQQIRELLYLLKQIQAPGSRLSIGQRDLIYLWARKLVREPEKLEEYIRVVVKNTAGVDGVQFLTPKLAIKVIEALKAAARRKQSVANH